MYICKYHETNNLILGPVRIIFFFENSSELNILETVNRPVVGLLNL